MSRTQVTNPDGPPSFVTTPDHSSEPLTVTVEQAARRLGISRSTAYECVRNGSLPSLRFRRRIVIPSSVVDRLLNGATVEHDHATAG